MQANDYRQSHTAPGKAEAYDSRFSSNGHRALMWELERKILDDIASEFFQNHIPRHLDFACGTGRIVAHLEDRAGQSVGVDLAPNMLDVARSRTTKAELIQADLTRHDVLGSHVFDLVTAFRFFPNAQPTLRAEALNVIRRHLTDGGYFVFNNHLNRNSSFLRLARLAGFGRDLGMTPQDTVGMLAQAKIDIVKVYHLGALPSNEHYLLLPLPVVRRTEHFASKCAMFRGISQNLIYVCRVASKTGS